MVFQIQSATKKCAVKAQRSKVEQLFQSSNRVMCYSDSYMRKGNVGGGAVLFTIEDE